MKKNILTILAVAALAAPLVTAPSMASAQDWHRDGGDRPGGGHGHDGGPGDGRGPNGGSRDNHWQGSRDGGWDPADHYRDGGRYRDRRLGRGDDVFRGHDGRYYCRRNDGTTGLVIGALGGGVLGNIVGDGGTLGTLLGAGGGALLGRSIDRGHIHCR